MSEWRTIDSAPEGIKVMTKIHDELGSRNEQSLVKRTRIPGKTRPLWWHPDGTMYVYYEPTHWHPMHNQRALSAVEEKDDENGGYFK